MATKLEEYQRQKDMYLAQVDSGQMNVEDMIYLCELNYRIEVLATFQLFHKTIPMELDEDKISFHYQFVELFITILTKEKRYSKKADENIQLRRDTALNYFKNVVESGKKQIMAMKLTTTEQYKNVIDRYCNTVLIAWLQLRETYIDLEGGQRYGTNGR